MSQKHSKMPILLGLLSQAATKVILLPKKGVILECYVTK